MSKAYSAEILSVGTELLLGGTTNTDARDISIYLSQLGINVFYHTVVGDNPERLKKAVQIARERADIIVTTGGLGPTCDDLTKQVLAESFGLKLVFHQEVADDMKRYFKEVIGVDTMTENNLQQALLPEGCTVFKNDWGTAPGCAFESGGTRVLMLPGPPRECNAMFKARAIPYLAALSDEIIFSHNINIMGMGESAVESMLRDMMNSLHNPTLAPYAKEGEVMLRVTAKAGTKEEAESMTAPVVEKLRGVLGDFIYGIDSPSLEYTVSEGLRARGLTMACAESCTGGNISKRLTDLKGASEIFVGGAVTYTPESKSKLLGVAPGLIEEKGVVSAEVASEMAKGAGKLFGADLAVATTGLAGPDGDGVNPVGTVFVALAAGDEVFVNHLHGGRGRGRNRTMASNCALDMVRRWLEGKAVVYDYYRRDEQNRPKVEEKR